MDNPDEAPVPEPTALARIEPTTLERASPVTLELLDNVSTLNATRADVEEQLEGIGGLAGALLLVRRINAHRITEEGRRFLHLVEALAKNPKVRIIVDVRTEGDPLLEGQRARVVIGE